MKFHALALCLASTVITVVPAQADDHDRRSDRMTRHEQSLRDRAMYTEERLYFIGNLYPDLPPMSEVAMKVSDVVANQHMEISHLVAMRPAAQTAGFNNIVTVYDAMIEDHNKVAEFGSQWLTKYGYPVPSRPTAVAAVADMSPTSGVEHQIEMHQRMFNESLAKRQNERSSTVRGLLLWSAAGSARHLSWLRALDRDVDMGRKTVSARLNSVMTTDVIHDQLVERITIEDREYFSSTTTQPQIVEQVVEVPTTVERIVEVEKIVERPVERIVERVVEKPVYVERIVEKPVYIQRPTRARVAGQRGTYRRPAK